MSINDEITEKYNEIGKLERKIEELQKKLNDAKIQLQSLLHANSYIREHSGEPTIV